jgi:hypothetical protein
MKHYLFDLPPDRIELLFVDAERIPKEHPLECLAHDQLWSDSSEKANGITRDRATGELCYSVAIFHQGHQPQIQFAFARKQPRITEIHTVQDRR